MYDIQLICLSCHLFTWLLFCESIFWSGFVFISTLRLYKYLLSLWWRVNSSDSTVHSVLYVVSPYQICIVNGLASHVNCLRGKMWILPCCAQVSIIFMNQCLSHRHVTQSRTECEHTKCVIKWWVGRNIARETLFWAGCGEDVKISSLIQDDRSYFHSTNIYHC